MSKKAKLTPAATTQMLEAEAVEEEAKAEEAQAQEAKAEKATAEEATAAVKTGTKKAAKLSLEASVKAALGSTEKVRVVVEDFQLKLYYGTECEWLSDDSDGLSGL